MARKFGHIYVFGIIAESFLSLTEPDIVLPFLDIEAKLLKIVRKFEDS